MTAECPSVTAWMMALPVSRPRGWPGAGAPVPSAVAVAAVAAAGSAEGSASC